MTPQTVGTWLLLLCGLALIGRGIMIANQQTEKALRLRWLVGTGFLCLGLGAFDLEFLVRLGECLKQAKPIIEMANSTDASGYKKVIDSVAEGKLDPEYRDLGLAYAVQQDPPGLDQMLDQAIAGAKQPEDRQALEKSRQDLAEKRSIESVTSLAKAENSEAYRDFFHGVAAGRLLPTHTEIGLNYALHNPVEKMDQYLRDSAEEAPPGSSEKTALEQTAQEFAVRESLIRSIDEGRSGQPVQPSEIKRIIPAYRKFERVPR